MPSLLEEEMFQHFLVFWLVLGGFLLLAHVNIVPETLVSRREGSR